jgi:hypothetical protein
MADAVGIVTGRPKDLGCIPEGQSVQTDFGARSVFKGYWGLFLHGLSERDVKLSTHLI